MKYLTQSETLTNLENQLMIIKKMLGMRDKLSLLITYTYWGVLSHSVVSNSETPWSVAHQAPLFMGVFQARKVE